MNIAVRLKVIAETLLSITAIIMIIIAIKVISLGEALGVQILLFAVFFAMFMWLGWIQPKATGTALLLLGTVILIFFRNLRIIIDAWNLFGVPILIAGLLFLGAGWERHKTV